MKQVLALIAALACPALVAATADDGGANLRGGTISNSTLIQTPKTSASLPPISPSSVTRKAEGCHDIRLDTSWKVNYATSKGRFHIVGYGDVRPFCTETKGASCRFYDVCTGDTMTIKAYTKDGWLFKPLQECSNPRRVETLELIDRTVVPGGYDYTQDFSWIDTNQFYEHVNWGFYYPDRSCHKLRFTTADEVPNAQTRATHMALGFVGWWNYLPKSCMNAKGAWCDYEVCHPRGLPLRSITLWSGSTDGWNYKVEEFEDYDDDKSLKRMHFDASSRYPTWQRENNYGSVWMDTDQFLSEATFRFAC